MKFEEWQKKAEEIYEYPMVHPPHFLDVIPDWKDEREKLIEVLKEVAGYRQDDGLCWCFDPYTNPDKHDACCLKARAVLAEERERSRAQRR